MQMMYLIAFHTDRMGQWQQVAVTIITRAIKTKIQHADSTRKASKQTIIIMYARRHH